MTVRPDRIVSVNVTLLIKYGISVKELTLTPYEERDRSIISDRLNIERDTSFFYRAVVSYPRDREREMTYTSRTSFSNARNRIACACDTHSP